MANTDRTIILDLLDRAKVEYEYHDRARRSIPGSVAEIEVHNTSTFGDENASTMWVFDIDGNLLQIGSFSN